MSVARIESIMLHFTLTSIFECTMYKSSCLRGPMREEHGLDMRTEDPTSLKSEASRPPPGSYEAVVLHSLFPHCSFALFLRGP